MKIFKIAANLVISDTLYFNQIGTQENPHGIFFLSSYTFCKENITYIFDRNLEKLKTQAASNKQTHYLEGVSFPLHTACILA